jgi:hypothetical protein
MLSFYIDYKFLFLVESMKVDTKNPYIPAMGFVFLSELLERMT